MGGSAAGEGLAGGILLLSPLKDRAAVRGILGREQRRTGEEGEKDQRGFHLIASIDRGPGG